MEESLATLCCTNNNHVDRKDLFENVTSDLHTMDVLSIHINGVICPTRPYLQLFWGIKKEGKEREG